MIDKFLKAKHWQLFLLTFGIPLVFQLVMMATMMANIGSGESQDFSFMMYYFRLFPVLMIIFTGVLFGWFWSVAVGLQRMVPEHVHLRITRFKILVFIPLFYMLFIFTFLAVAMTGMTGSYLEGLPSSMASAVWIIVPMHLFSLFCIFHSMYFVAKTFKTVELQREAAFSDFAGEFFMIWFYPIGIWIVQPKINKMVNE